jgi:hypothetical protein
VFKLNYSFVTRSEKVRRNGQQTIQYNPGRDYRPPLGLEPRGTGLKLDKKRKRKLLIWLAVDMTIAVIFITMLLYTPGRYDPPKPAVSNEVSPYLTHELLSQLFNKTQEDVPFELVIEQAGINDAIARADWPYYSDDVTFWTPQIFFNSDAILIMGPVELKGVEFVITARISPRLDEQGLLHLNVETMKVGVMNLTPIAKIIGQKMYQYHTTMDDIETNDLRARLAGALFAKTPFLPLLQFGSKKVLMDRINIEESRLIIGFSPANEMLEEGLRW